MVARGIINGEHLESQAVVIHNAARILYANQRTAALLGVADARKSVGQIPLSLVSPGSLTTVLYYIAGSDEGSEAIDIVSDGVWRDVLYC
jgi:hypothetical protein